MGWRRKHAILSRSRVTTEISAMNDTMHERVSGLTDSTADSISTVMRDAEGYLVEPQAWTEAIACRLAEEEGIVIDDEYRTVIRFMRAYYDERQIAPDVRHVVTHLAQLRGCDKQVAKDRLFELFPYGYVKQACKIAGMKRPRAWSTG